MGLGSCLCNLYLNNQQVAGKCCSERFGGHSLTQTLPTSPSQEDKEILEKQMRGMAVVIEKLESSRQKLLMEEAMSIALHWENQVKDYLKQNEALRGILDKLRTDQAKELLDSHHNGSNKTGLAEYTPEVLSVKDQLAKEQSKAEALSAVVYGEV